MTDQTIDEATRRWADAAQLMAAFCADPRYKTLTGAALWFKIMPALALGQYAIARRNKPLLDGRTLPAPVGAVLYARVDNKTHKDLLGATKAPLLALDGWNSGENIWIIDTPGEPEAVGKLLNQLYDERFDRRPFNALVNQGGEAVKAHVFQQ